MPIIRNREHVLTADGSPDLTALAHILKEHDELKARYDMLEDYYDGVHPITARELDDPDAPNNRLVINYAEYISDFASSYFMGNEVEYVSDHIDPIRDAFRAQHIHMVDTELARDLSRFGVAYELVYMSSDEAPVPKSTNIDPRNAVIVVDDTVEYKTILGIYRYVRLDKGSKEDGETVMVYTSTHIYEYHYKQDLKPIEDNPHPFGSCPMLEYWNKPNLKADYESVLSLIDAYNILMSDRVNDKERFVHSLLVVYGAVLGDTTEEATETVRALKKLGILELSGASSAEYISNQLDEADTEILKNSIKTDIHKISKVPDMTDENFASNSSGVAMKYKLLGLEQLTKTKEAYYKMSLRDRLRLYEAIYHIKSADVSVDDVEIVMRRSLPTNEVETANMVVSLKDQVSQQTLLAQLPFVQDIDAEIARLQEQKEQSIAMMQQSFGATGYPSYEQAYAADDEDNGREVDGEETAE